jgi:hypothetical protein
MHRHHVWLTIGLLLAWPGCVQATPFFARAYHFKCQTCHSGFPRLNPFGLAFKANNFRIPGGERYSPMAWQKTPPLAAQVEPTTERFSPGRIESDYTDTQLLAGGLLTRTTSFYVHHELWIDAIPPQFPSYEVWVQQVLDERTQSMLKVGQFELPYAYSPFINMATVNQPLFFGARIQGNDVLPGGPMRGIQFSGIIEPAMRWYFAWGAPSLLLPGNTTGARSFFGNYPDVFLRFSTRDVARNLGFFAFLTDSSRVRTDVDTQQRGQRYGFDGAVTWRGVRFYGMAAYGEDSNPVGNGTRGYLRSGFLEADRMLTPWLGLTGRWDIQTVNIATTRDYTDARTISLRMYPIPNIKLIAEYQQADHGRSSTVLQAGVTF